MDKDESRFLDIKDIFEEYYFSFIKLNGFFKFFLYVDGLSVERGNNV